MKDQDDGSTGELPGMWTESSGVMTAGQHLQRMKDEWEETIKGDGGCCPVCGKFGKVYRIKLSQALALSLKWMADNAGEDGWVDVQTKGPRWMLRAKTYPLLVHWGMLESRQPRSGVWRVTPQGRDFIAGTEVAPKAVYIYDNALMALDAESTTFRGCFGVKFDFDELMSANFNWWANVASLEK